MKEGWEIKHLGELCSISTGKSNTEDAKSDGEFAFFDRSKIVKRSDRFLFDCEALIIAGEGQTFFPKYFKGKFDLHQRAYAIYNFNKNVDIKFVFQNLVYNQKYFQDVAVGATAKSLRLRHFQDLPIPTPSLPEQQRIVSIIDEAFEAIDKAIENTQKNLQNAKELFESTVRKLFELKGKDWPVIKLGEICKINDGTHFSPKNNSEGKYMYITAKNIKPYYITLKNVTFISEKDHKEIYSRCSPKKGDVLYIKDGATTGIAAINDIDQEFSLLSSVALLKCSDRIINSFLVHYMNSSIGKENFLGYIDGAAITRLTLIKIKNVEINLPPYHEQLLIVDKLDQLRIESEKLQSKYQQKLRDLEELKKSVLNKAFAGEL